MYIHVHMYIEPTAFGVSFNLNLQFQCHRSLVNEMRQKRLRELDHRMKLETEEMTLQTQ